MWRAAFAGRGAWVRDGVYHVGLRTRAALSALLSFVYTARVPSHETLVAWLREDGVIAVDSEDATAVDEAVLALLVELSQFAGPDQRLVRSPLSAQRPTLEDEATRVACRWLDSRAGTDVANSVAVVAQRTGCKQLGKAARAWLVTHAESSLAEAIDERIDSQCAEAALRDEVSGLRAADAELRGEVTELRGEVAALRAIVDRLANRAGPL